MRISDFDDEELVFINMVNEHSDEIRRNAINTSLQKEVVPYNQKKKKNTAKWRTAVAAIALLAMIFGGVKMAQAMEVAEVTKTINYYQSVMDSSEDREKNQHSIENFVGYSYEHGTDPIVSYENWNNSNFANYVLEASRSDIPVTNVRCALIAAYHVINEPYREKQFKILFDSIKNNEEFINNTGLDGSKDSIWQMLGYEDIKDFQNNVRKDTEKIYLSEREEKHGKGM